MRSADIDACGSGRTAGIGVTCASAFGAGNSDAARTESVAADAADPSFLNPLENMLSFSLRDFFIFPPTDLGLVGPNASDREYEKTRPLDIGRATLMP